MYLHIGKCKANACKLIKQRVKIFVKCKTTFYEKGVIYYENKRNVDRSGHDK